MPKIKSLLKLIIPLLIGLVLVLYSLNEISIKLLWQYFKGANYYLILLGILLSFLSHSSRAYRWKYMVAPMGYKPSFLNSLMSVYAAYIINLTIPRAGEVARATILKNYEKLPFDKALGTIVAERIADTFMLLLIIGIALCLEFDFIFDFLNSKFNLLSIIIAILVMVLLGLLLYKIIRNSKSKFIEKVNGFIRGMFDGITSIFKMKNKWLFIAHTFFIWFSYVAMFYITSFALPQLEGVTFPAILIGFILASFSIAATNGGIGSFPEAIVIAFLLFGIQEDPSRAFGWILWSSQTLAIIFFGGLSLIILPIYNRNKKRL